MSTNDPVATVDARFSVAGAPAVPWPEARQVLEEAGTYWLATVRSDGRPHVTTLIAIWHDDALYFSTGPAEQKAKNLGGNPHCILTTGCNRLDSGLDVVVEGIAVRVTDNASLRALAEAWQAKYGSDWPLAGSQEAPDLVFRVTPIRAFGFRKGFGEGGQGCQTRWRWTAGEQVADWRGTGYVGLDSKLPLSPGRGRARLRSPRDAPIVRNVAVSGHITKVYPIDAQLTGASALTVLAFIALVFAHDERRQVGAAAAVFGGAGLGLGLSSMQTSSSRVSRTRAWPAA